MPNDDLNEADLQLGSNLPPVAPTKRRGKPTTVGMPETVRLLIEENDSIPPTGVYVGLNGKGYLIRAGETVDVPIGVKDILDNAIETVPQIDPTTRRIIAHRERMRYPYRLIAQ